MISKKSMLSKRVFSLMAFCGFLLCSIGNLYAQKDWSHQWVESLVKTKMDVLSAISEVPDLNGKKFVAHKGGSAVPVSLNIEGAESLVLKTTRNRASQWDYSVWANARLTTTDGHVVFLAELPYEVGVASYDYGNSIQTGYTAVIGGISYDHAVSCFADGLLVYSLAGKDYVKFDADIGIDEVAAAKGNSTAIFEVSNVYVEPYVEQLSESFPKEMGLYFSQIMKQKNGWTELLKTPSAAIERQSILDVLYKLKQDTRKYRKEIDKISKKGKLEDQLRAYLSLYIEVKKSYDRQREADRLFSFAFFTDVHLMPGEFRQSQQKFDKALDHVNYQNFDFIFFNGDNIAKDKLPALEADTLMRRFKNMVERKITQPAYYALGNHDITYVTDDKTDSNKVKIFEKVFGLKEYYSFDHEDVHFIVLNSNLSPDGKYGNYAIRSDQINWLEKDLLEVGNEKPIIVFTHVPFQSMYYPAVSGKISTGDMVSNFKEVWDILLPYNVQLIMQGHQHIYEEIAVRDTRFITGGAVCGNWWLPGDLYLDTYRGYMIVEVDKDRNFTWEYINY